MKNAMLISVTAALVLGGLALVQAMPQAEPNKGIGPIKEVKLEPIDAKMAQGGKKIFESKCFVCHALDTKVIGPTLRDVAKRRTPEYIMNMLLNVDEMLAKDPDAMKVRAQYPVPMTDQQLTQEQARRVLEYLRQAAEEKKDK